MSQMVLIKRNVYECFFKKKKKETSALQIVHDTTTVIHDATASDAG